MKMVLQQASVFSQLALPQNYFKVVKMFKKAWMHYEERR